MPRPRRRSPTSAASTSSSRAAKKEGTLRTIALPPDWADYAEIIKTFEDKYGIKIENENPDGSSSDEINAVKTAQGSGPRRTSSISGSPSLPAAPGRVVRALQGRDVGRTIPAEQKDPDGKGWVNDYGGLRVDRLRRRQGQGVPARRTRICSSRSTRARSR